MLGLFGVVLIVYGIVALVARDAMWSLTTFNNALSGVASERGELWETKTAISGVIALVVGLILIVAQCGGGAP